MAPRIRHLSVPAAQHVNVSDEFPSASAAAPALTCTRLPSRRAYECRKVCIKASTKVEMTTPRSQLR